MSNTLRQRPVARSWPLAKSISASAMSSVCCCYSTQENRSFSWPASTPGVSSCSPPAVASLGRKAFVAAMAAHVGLDPRKDLTFASHPAAEAISLLEKGEIDAMLGFPPDPQELRARKIGHSIVNTTTDRPWSQYFCCIAAGNREFVRSNPVATKAVIRSFLKAASVCAREPERIARLLTDRGFIKQYEYGVQALKEIPYNRWREFDSADTVRYYALRLHETGMIKSTPQSLLAAGTDWRFLDELKPELKG